MIPNDRPVLGKDLDTVRQQFGILTSDACWLFGLSMTRWMHIVRRDAELPVTDPTLALLVRLLDQHPELSVIPKFPDADEMFELVSKIQETNQRKFAVLFGSEASAAYRWLKAGGRQSPAVSRLMFFLKLGLMAKPSEKRGEMLDEWQETVRQEAISRDVPDVFASGKWNQAGVAIKAALKAAEPNAYISKKGRKKAEPTSN